MSKKVKKLNKKKVAVVIPLSNRSELLDDEKISLRHLTRYLDKYDKFFVMPETLEFAITEGFKEKRFSNSFFGSVANYNRLMLSRILYESFIEYEYILIYHLDALVFSDRLLQWCDKAYDYIGSPWIEHKDTPYVGNKEWEGLVGNGGFCLRNVNSCLKVLNSKVPCETPDKYWKRCYSKKSLSVRIFNYPKKWLKHCYLFRNGVDNDIAKHKINEEHFWVHRARHYYSDFKFAPLKEALKFGFECVPAYCYQQNNDTLPFGCHAWGKYDKAFWEQFLISE